MSLEQIDANRRLLHAELKDKVNPLVFSKERAIRAERERELEALRARELMLDRERFKVMDRLSEERKRKRPGEGDVPFALLGQRTSPPSFGRAPIDREEYERLKRLRLAPVSSLASFHPGSHRLAIGVSHHVEVKGKDDRVLLSPAKTHSMLPSQRRPELENDKVEMRLARPRDLDFGSKGTGIMLAEREAMWLREHERAIRVQEELNRKRAGIHGATGMPGFIPPKGADVLPPRDGSRKSEEEGVNRCSVCKRDASFLCSGCQSAWYCSSECQVRVW